MRPRSVWVCGEAPVLQDVTLPNRLILVGAVPLVRLLVTTLAKTRTGYLEMGRLWVREMSIQLISGRRSGWILTLFKRVG